MNQRSFASAECGLKNKRTRREKFLVDMERVVPWSRLITLTEPLYPTIERVSRQPIGVPRMQRMCCLQQGCGLADAGQEDALYDSQALRGFVGLVLSVGRQWTARDCRRCPEDTELLEPEVSGTSRTRRA